jgi:hypothetical protein
MAPADEAGPSSSESFVASQWAARSPTPGDEQARRIAGTRIRSSRVESGQCDRPLLLISARRRPSVHQGNALVGRHARGGILEAMDGGFHAAFGV